MTRRYFIFVFALLVFAVPGRVWAQAPAGPPISGIVFRQSQNKPIGGVTVSLVHPVLGRGKPSFSAPNGYYYFANVPPRPEPYYIEAYWGSRLIYRGTVLYRGGSVQFNIPLP